MKNVREKPMIKCIVLTHGDLGFALLNTTEKIIGPLEGIKVISNELTSLKDLITNLDSIVKNWEESEILIMVDFCGGSCWHAARVIKRSMSNIALLSGVNLPMMLSFVNKRESYKLPDLAYYLKECSLKGTEVIAGEEKQE